MTLPKTIDRCDKDECCCKCELAYTLRTFSALNPEIPNYHYVCSVFRNEGIMLAGNSPHGLCEMFTKDALR